MSPADKGATPYGQGQAPGEHGNRVASMFGRIAGVYDVLNRVLSLGLDQRWRAELIRAVDLPAGGTLVDVAAGTLDVTLKALAAVPDARAVALDFSAPMLAKGKGKIPTGQQKRVLPALADGRKLPLPGACADGLTIAFGIRNIVPRAEALAEAYRVLKPGGKLAILEFGSGKSRIMLGIYNFYLGTVLPRIGKLVSGDAGAYGYLADTITGFPTADDFAAELRDAGFSTVTYRRLTWGIVYIHIAKKNS